MADAHAKGSRRKVSDAEAESRLLTIYRFNAAPAKLRRLFGRSASASWLAHIDASVAASFESLLASWTMRFRPADRRSLADGSLVVIGEFDPFA